MYPYQNYGIGNFQYPQYQQMMPQNMDRLGQLQNMQQPLSRAIGIHGGVVEDFSMITANDVPMDGTGAVFVKRDGSEVQIRNWTANGTIATSVFKPVKSEVTEKTSGGIQNDLESAYTLFEDKFRQLFDKIDKLEEAVIEVSLNKGVKSDE